MEKVLIGCFSLVDQQTQSIIYFQAIFSTGNASTFRVN